MTAKNSLETPLLFLLNTLNEQRFTNSNASDLIRMLVLADSKLMGLHASNFTSLLLVWCSSRSTSRAEPANVGNMVLSARGDENY